MRIIETCPRCGVELFTIYLLSSPSNTWCFSGFTIEEITQDNEKKKLLDMCDTLIDGMFDIDKRDVTLRFRGSSNQRIFHRINGQWIEA